MSQPKLWINEIIDALIDLEGEGSLEAINEQIAKRNVMNFYPNWPHTVRRTIEEHSSDTQSFHSKGSPKERDIFFAPYGIRKGCWAIRSSYWTLIEDARATNFEEEQIPGGFEGGKTQRYVNTYERDITLRKAAIDFHGTTCKGCGFNFEATYGERGSGYIEVHHLRPISRLGGSVYINPQTDMTVLCSNCHRMIHRKHNEILTLEELQTIIAHERDKSDSNSTAIYTATPAKNHVKR